MEEDRTQEVMDWPDNTQWGDGESSEQGSQGESEEAKKSCWGALYRQLDNEVTMLTYRVKDERRDTFAVGRNTACDLVVADKRVSTRHCLIYCDYTQARLRIFLEDCSSNGTFINSSLHRLHNGERLELKTGDEIYLTNPRNMKPEDKALAFTFKNLRERMLGDIERPIERAPAPGGAGVQPASTARHVEDLYIIGDQIGAGMCGTVHVCVEIATRIQRAVKVIDTKKFALSPGLSPKDLREEAKMMQSLDHPNIIKIIDTFETENIFFIVMELVRGGDLFDRIVERGRYSEDMARQVFSRVLGAVDYLHSNRIIHRDLKPENILLVDPDSDFDIKITDFGLAKRTNQEGLKTFCGTPQYFAPEVLKRRSTVAHSGSYGTKADVWSLGVVLYILLSGTFPFDEDNLFDQIQHAHFSVAGPEWTHVSDGAKHLVRALLKLRPEERIPVSEALQHPWITGAYFPDTGSRKEGIRRYVGSSGPRQGASQETQGAGVRRMGTNTTGRGAAHTNSQGTAATPADADGSRTSETDATGAGGPKPLALWSKSLSVKRSQGQGQGQCQGHIGAPPTSSSSSAWAAPHSQSQPALQSQSQPQSLFRAATSGGGLGLGTAKTPIPTPTQVVGPISSLSRDTEAAKVAKGPANAATSPAKRQAVVALSPAKHAPVAVAAAANTKAKTSTAAAAATATSTTATATTTTTTTTAPATALAPASAQTTTGKQRPPRAPRAKRGSGTRARAPPPGSAAWLEVGSGVGLSGGAGLCELLDDCIEQYSSSEGEGEVEGEGGRGREREQELDPGSDVKRQNQAQSQGQSQGAGTSKGSQPSAKKRRTLTAATPGAANKKRVVSSAGAGAGAGAGSLESAWRAAGAKAASNANLAQPGRPESEDENAGNAVASASASASVAGGAAMAVPRQLRVTAKAATMATVFASSQPLALTWHQKPKVSPPLQAEQHSPL